jgi:hypothetical protein
MGTSEVVFVRNDVAPQVGARETHRPPLKISFVFPKRLFQHYLPNADMPPTEFTILSGCTLPSLIQARDARCSRRQRRFCG